jgi:hypothetical protein
MKETNMTQGVSTTRYETNVGNDDGQKGIGEFNETLDSSNLVLEYNETFDMNSTNLTIVTSVDGFWLPVKAEFWGRDKDDNLVQRGTGVTIELGEVEGQTFADHAKRFFADKTQNVDKVVLTVRNAANTADAVAADVIEPFFIKARAVNS